MKKEIIEAAENLVKSTTLYGSQEATIGSSTRSYFETELRCVLLGIKYQQEKSYSEEEVKEILLKCTWILKSSKLKWFEQFKKK